MHVSNERRIHISVYIYIHIHTDVHTLPLSFNTQTLNKTGGRLQRKLVEVEAKSPRSLPSCSLVHYAGFCEEHLANMPVLQNAFPKRLLYNSEQSTNKTNKA